MGTYGAGLYGAGLYGIGQVTATPTLLSVAPASLYTTSPPTLLTFTGANTTWLSVAPTITVSAGSLGARTAQTNTSATATYTPPGTAQNVTFTDTTDGSSTVILGVTVPPVIPPQVLGAPPVLWVEVSFSTNPTQPPVWVNITQYVERVSITRGRNRELDRTEGGHCVLDCDNRLRTFDPTYAAGPFYPNVLPMRRIRVRATYANAIIPIFSGYIESYGQSWRSFQDSVVTITASDAFKPLNLAQLNATFPAQTSGARVGAVLDAIYWTIGGPAWTLGTSTLGVTTVLGPVGDRNLATGLTTVQESTLADTSALSHLQDVVDTEQGLLFADRDGVVTFYSRDRAFQPSQLGSQAVFGELEMPYVDIELEYSDSQIWNDVRITRQGGNQQVASDVPSQLQYYIRTLARSTLHNSDGDSLIAAQGLVTKTAQPSLQIVSMTLDGEANPTVIYPQMLGHEIGDRITVRRRPQTGSLIEQISLIQGIAVNYDARGGEWSVVWRLSAVDTHTYWVLGDATYGLLGTMSRLFA